MSNVLVDLPRQFTWSAGEGAATQAYGPGRTLVPKPMADLLLEMGMITWMDENGKAPKWSDADRFTPSELLPPDFPAREYLFLAGHLTYKNVADLTEDQVVSLRGVGEARAKQILEAQAIVREKLPKRIDPSELHAKVFVRESWGSSVPVSEEAQPEEPDGTQPATG